MKTREVLAQPRPNGRQSRVPSPVLPMRQGGVLQCLVDRLPRTKSRNGGRCYGAAVLRSPLPAHGDCDGLAAAARAQSGMCPCIKSSPFARAAAILQRRGCCEPRDASLVWRHSDRATEGLHQYHGRLTMPDERGSMLDAGLPRGELPKYFVLVHSRRKPAYSKPQVARRMGYKLGVEQPFRTARPLRAAVKRVCDAFYGGSTVAFPNHESWQHIKSLVD
jgi:hypothetical protein